MGSMRYAALGLRGLEGLASLGQVGRCIFDSVEAKELTKDAGMDLGADIAELGFLYQSLEKPSQNTVRPGGSDIQTCISIVYGTLTLFTVLELLNGWGLENCGNEFSHGESQFGDINKTLQDADPDYGKWSGPSADAYGELNRKLSALVVTVENSDRQVAAILRCQADQVQEGRERLAGTVLALNGLLLLLLTVATCTFTYDAAGVIIPSNGAGSKTGALAADGGPELQAGAKPASPWLAGMGWATSVLEQYLLVMALTVCVSAVTVASAFLGELIAKGLANADGLRDQAHSYHQVVDGAAAIVRDTDGAMTEMPAIASRPTIFGSSILAFTADAEITSPGVFGRAGGLGDKPALVEASTNSAVSGGDDALAVPTFATHGAPATAPGVVELDQPDEGAAEQPGDVFALLNLDGRSAERAPLVAMARQRTVASAKRSDPDEFISTQDGTAQIVAAVDGDEAGAAATFAAGHERAVPADVVAMGAEPAQESGRTQRSL